MGAYLSQPITDLVAEDGRSSKLVYGSAAMQGWRVSQEDAHIAIEEFDKSTDTSLFAVFDGHGGPEVAQYCAQHLPNFIKSLASYQNTNIVESLEEAFLKFDNTLTKPEVIKELKLLAGTEELDKEIDEEDINEAILLREEADIPIADLMARYNSKGCLIDESEVECSSSTSIRLKFPLPSHMRSEMTNKDNQKPLSPYLRAKKNRTSELNHEMSGTSQMCSSSSSSFATSSKISQEVSNSETNSTSQPDSTIKPDVDSNEESANKVKETNECNESKVSNGEVFSSNDKPSISSTDCQSTTSITNQNDLAADGNEVIVSENKLSDEKDNKDLQSNCVTNAENSNKVDDQTSGSVSVKGKGKHKKILPQKRVSAVSTTNLDDEEIANPIYQSFLDDFDESDDDSSNDDFNANLSSDDEDDDEDEEEDEDEESSDDDMDDEDSGLLVQSSGGYEEPGRDSGCTAVVALLRGNDLYVANAGDSRCVVSRNGKAIEMSIDHKPEDEIERTRVEKAGGKVTPDGRVNGGLNLSRAIGDHAYKDNTNVSDREQMITALPDIKTLSLEIPNDKFMVIACDGIWNSLTSQQVVDFVGERIDKVQKLSTICDELFKHCLAPNTMGDGTGCDNMTAIIVKFENLSSKRKLHVDTNDEVESNVETDLKTEPEAKRIKTTDNCENDNEVKETEIIV